jgi:NAD(P)-dependent dehydrogenase (short-subunit alcohol dehydrogenase family)
VVTGAASGLGQATARALALRGVRVAVFDRDVEKGQAIADEIQGIFCEVDVTADSSLDSAFVRARGAHGQERILVNCAGGGSSAKTLSRDKKTGAIKALSAAEFTKWIHLNLVGTFSCSVKAAAGMMTLDPIVGERGSIVNTASIAGIEGQIGQVAYAAAKAGIIGMTLPMARDLSSEGIRVNTILPGVFDTPPMLAAPQAMRDTLYASIPFPKRGGDPVEFAELAVHICSNGYINGEHIRIDGAVRFGPR